MYITVRENNIVGDTQSSCFEITFFSNLILIVQLKSFNLDILADERVIKALL
jgi:hypothetical protein